MKTIAISDKALTKPWVKDLTLIFMGSIAISLLGMLSIPLPFTPVPIVLQNTFAISLGIFLGPRRGALSVLLFLAQGAMGLPVFAGGAFGLANLIGPRGGYLLGYAVAAFVVGVLHNRMKSSSLTRDIALFTIGSTIIFLFGMSHLSHFVGFKKAFLLGVAPFIPGALVKISLMVKFKQLYFQKFQRILHP